MNYNSDNNTERTGQTSPSGDTDRLYNEYNDNLTARDPVQPRQTDGRMNQQTRPIQTVRPGQRQGTNQNAIHPQSPQNQQSQQSQQTHIRPNGQNIQNRQNLYNSGNGRQTGGYIPGAGYSGQGSNQRPYQQNNGQRQARNNQTGQNGSNGGQKKYVTPGSGGSDIRLRKSTRKTDRNRVIIIAIIAVLLVTLIIIGVSAMNYRPLGSVDVPWQIASSGDEYGETTTDDGRPKRENADVVPATYTRSNPSKYNFLVVGKDHVSSNTDVIWLVSFNVDTGEVSVMQIPRDTMLRYNGGKGRRLNAMYSLHYNEAARAGRTDSEERIKYGMEGLVADIERNMCVNIDYWVIVNLEGFGQIVDTIGGVEIDVPYDLDYEDPYQDLYIHIKAGPQVMDGDTAQGYMRYRSGYVQGDIGRVTAQKVMITALLKTFKEKFTIFMISDLVKTVYQNVRTNMTTGDIGYLGRKALGVDLGSLTMMTLPGEATQASTGAWYYIMKRADTLFLVNKYFNVYDQPVTESDFDRNELFNDGSSGKVMKIYYSVQKDDPVAEYVRSGQSVDESSVKIDFVPETTAEDDLASTSGADQGEEE